MIAGNLALKDQDFVEIQNSIIQRTKRLKQKSRALKSRINKQKWKTAQILDFQKSSPETSKNRVISSPKTQESWNNTQNNIIQLFESKNNKDKKEGNKSAVIIERINWVDYIIYRAWLREWKNNYYEVINNYKWKYVTVSKFWVECCINTETGKVIWEYYSKINNIKEINWEVYFQAEKKGKKYICSSKNTYWPYEEIVWETIKTDSWVFIKVKHSITNNNDFLNYSYINLNSWENSWFFSDIWNVRNIGNRTIADIELMWRKTFIDLDTKELFYINKRWKLTKQRYNNWYQSFTKENIQIFKNAHNSNFSIIDSYEENWSYFCNYDVNWKNIKYNLDTWKKVVDYKKLLSPSNIIKKTKNKISKIMQNIISDTKELAYSN